MSPYYTRVREAVGSGLLLVPAAGAAVFDGRGRLLLGRHVDPGHWGTLGGAVEPGESPQQAALRELSEETGFRGEVRGLVGAFGGSDFEVTYASGDRVAYVVSVFACRLVGGAEALQPEEIAEIGWYERAAAMSLPHPPDMAQILAAAFDWWAGHGRRQDGWDQDAHE